jgi:hypothetical protein
LELQESVLQDSHLAADPSAGLVESVCASISVAVVAPEPLIELAAQLVVRGERHDRLERLFGQRLSGRRASNGGILP